jgi:hypothetical protein
MNFRFSCAVSLYKELGRQDAIIETTEVAIRSFLFASETHGNFSSFLQAQSALVGIKVDDVNLENFRLRIALGYIVSIHQSLEIFLRDFKDEYVGFYNETWNFADLEGDLLSKTIQKIGKVDEVKKSVGVHLFSLLDYYRIVRNTFLHNLRIFQESETGKNIINKPNNRIENAFDELTPFLSTIANDFPKLKAPNRYSQIDFDDFILFTRVLKIVVDRLMEFCKPNENQLFDYYQRLQLFRKYPSGSARKKNALIGEMNNRFGIERMIAEKLLNSAFASLA